VRGPAPGGRIVWFGTATTPTPRQSHRTSHQQPGHREGQTECRTGRRRPYLRRLPSRPLPRVATGDLL